MVFGYVQLLPRRVAENDIETWVVAEKYFWK